MFKYIIILFGAIFQTFYVSAQSTDYAIEKYSIKNGLPSGKIETILQDHLGFIWIGTSNGLVKYDGYSFFTYKNIRNNNHSLANNIVTCIYESPDSVLFVATQGGLHIYNRNSDNFQRIAADNNIRFTKNFSVHSICSDRKGNYYITGIDNKAIFQLIIDKKSNHSRIKAFQYPQNTTYNYGVTCFDTKERLWLMSRSDILCFKNGKFTRIQMPKTISYIYFNTIVFSPVGKLFIATNKGLYYYNEVENSIEVFNLKLKTVKNEELNIDNLSIGNDGTFYITAENYGLIIVDKTGKQISHYMHDVQNYESIGNNTISAMYVDRKNNVWLGTLQNDLNVLLVKPKYFEKHIYAINGKNDGLKSNLINCCFEEGKNTLWLGTDGGGLQKYDLASNNITSVGNRTLKSNKIINLTSDSQQHLWICTYGGGLSMYDFKTSSIQNIPLLSKGKEVENVYDAKMIKLDILLVATLGQGLLTYNIKTKQCVSIDTVRWNNYNLKINQYISAIVIDKSSNIWISSFGEGLYVFNKDLKFIDHFDVTLPQRSLSNNIVSSLSLSDNGKLWVGTFDGIDIIDTKTKKIRVLNETDGLACPNSIHVNCIGNYAWVCTNDGISKINIQTLTIENLGETDGLWTSNSKYKFVSALHDGELLVGGDYGCMIFHKDSIKNRLLDLNFNITSIKANGESVGNMNDSPIELQYFQNNLSLEFVALLHNFSSQIEYEYSINGGKWIYLGKKHELLFPNLTDGKYSVKLKAFIIGKEKQAEILTVTIIIHPPFWKTWWFVICVILFIIAIVIFVVQQRLQQLKRQSFLLEQKVFERTQQIITQKDELKIQFEKLQEINDELVRTNSEQTKLFEIVSQKNINSTSEASSPKSNEEKILEKTIAFIQEYIDDEKLSVETISAHANYSKVQFYRIIKTLTELTPNDLIKTIRLQKAREMLTTGKYSVADVCYHVGFNDPRYFSRCFKEFYRILPSDCIPK